MTDHYTPATRGQGKQDDDPGGYVQCQGCETIMVGRPIVCSSCGSGAMLTRQDWDDRPFAPKERTR